MNISERKLLQDIERRVYEITYRGRREKHILQYNKDYEKYTSMPENEFSMEYIEVCSMYEHKKLIFSVVFLTVITFVIANVGNLGELAFAAVDLINEQSIMNESNIELVRFFPLFIIIMTVIVAIWTVYSLSRNIYMLNKKDYLWKN